MFQWYLLRMDDVYLVHEESRTPIPLDVDTSMSGCRAVTTGHAYDKVFPPYILQQQLPICYFEALNALVAFEV